MGKPVILVGQDPKNMPPEFKINPSILEAYKSAGILIYPTLEETVKAMATLVKYSQVKKRFSPSS
jgi:hypothetical protein